MKTSKYSAFVCCVFMMGAMQISAQEPTIKVDNIATKIQKYTMMEQFAPDLVVSANQRLAMKNQRIADTQRKLAILDTLDISDRKKRRLLRDLKNSPFSERLEKAIIVHTEFQDETENNN